VEAGRLDELAGLPPAAPGTVRVGLVATYARWKGQDVFLEAAARARAARTGPPLRFYLVGGPVYQTRGSQFTAGELRRLAARRGLAGDVGFVGFQPDPADVFRALDVVVHASTQPEPFGLTIVEGMACGRAVVAVGAGGAAELFRHGHDALGVPPGDAAALAGALRTLAEDAGLRRRLGAFARETATARFDSSNLGERLLRVYDSLAAGTPVSV
jgi:glycosyltransferase involved in cell wall biosynthesis